MNTEAGEMICPGCAFANPVGMKFCGQCGSGLEIRIPKPEIRKPADPRPYTPKHLAERVLQSKTALEGERKQVTVLFADVKGSMDLAEQVDPEQWHRIMDGFFQVLADGVHRFEGTVNQFTGDGIMALFGAPLALEDHAQRAGYAALHLNDRLRLYAEELKRTHGLAFAVRMGLNSGEVVVGRIGDDLRMDYTAIGHTVGLAQRMEQLAEPGRVYLTEHTARLMRGLFTLRDLGEFAIKGAQAPLRVHELEGVGPLRTRLDLSRARGFTRFVGRGTEMTTLEAALSRALAGEGAVVGIVAEPGVGKSRLCLEFVERCGTRGVEVREVRAVAQGKGTPLMVVLDLLRGVFDISARDSDRATREKVAGRVVLLDRELEDALPILFDFLGVPDPEHPAPRADPEAMQRRLFVVLRRLLHARSRRAPEVILIEDLHWMDAASELYIADLVESVATTRTLVVLNFRPEFHAAWMQGAHYQQLTLASLGPAATEELLDDLLGRDIELAPLRALLAARSGGNPFFVEEIVQTLAEEGAIVGVKGAYQSVRSIEALTVPPTVQALLAARIDRLAERDKRVLQTAAVIGHEFTERLLASALSGEVGGDALGAALHALSAAEFLFAVELWPEPRYAFKHPLTQEVANRSQLAERRTQVHAAVATALEQDNPAKADERAALLALHWEQAGNPLRAAQWELRAAAWASVCPLEERIRHWRRARTLADAAPESAEALSVRLRIRVSLASVGFLIGRHDEETTASIQEGMELARRLGDRETPVMLLTGYAMARHFAGAVDESLAIAQDATEQADAVGDPGLRCRARTVCARALLSAGRLRDVVATVNDAERFFEARDTYVAGGLRSEMLARMFRLVALTFLGRLADGEQEMRDTRAHVQRDGVDGTFEGHHVAFTQWATYCGFADQAVAHGRRAVAVAEAGGGTFHRLSTLSVLGLALVHAHRFDEASEALHTAVELMRESETGLFHAGATLAQLARAELGVGHVDQAHRTAEEALAAARRYRTPIAEIDALRARALVRLARDEPPVAVEDDLRAAGALVERTEAHVYTPLLHEDRAALARRLGDAAASHRELVEAHRLFTKLGATGHARRIESLRASTG